MTPIKIAFTVAILVTLVGCILWLVDLARRARMYSELKPRLDKLVVEESRLQTAQTAWLQHKQQAEAALDRLVQEKTLGFPWLASAWADYIALQESKQANRLESKRRPAPSAAQLVRASSAKRREAEKAWRVLKYQLAYYEALFPWLVDFREEGSSAVIQQTAPDRSAEGDDDQDEVDVASRWLTPSEYESLAPGEKYQLALDRYWKEKKSSWQLGRDYERFIGYLFESAGCAVYYQGIVEGLDDLGRDLIVMYQDGHVEIVQCKYWSYKRQVHEKHVFQLYGTLIAYRVDHATQQVSGALVTSTTLTERAREFAAILGINVVEREPIDAYPCIKCNVSQLGKIYHLPFDQQYDKTRIVLAKGERYAWTIDEAEHAGFRRAMRWDGSTDTAR